MGALMSKPSAPAPVARAPAVDPAKTQAALDRKRSNQQQAATTRGRRFAALDDDATSQLGGAPTKRKLATNFGGAA